MNTIAIGAAAIVLYLISSGMLLKRLKIAAGGEAPDKSLLQGLGLGAVALHAVVLYHGVVAPAGLQLGFFNALSLSAWVVAVVLLVSSFRQPVENLGIALLPVAAISLGLEVFAPGNGVLLTDAAWSLKAHILISILAYALLTIAAVQSVLLAIQDKHLRNRHPGGFIRALPALATMETLLFQMISVGFILLSLALLTGIFFLEDIFAQHLVHKTVLSIVAWVVFAVLLWGRWRYGWRGRTAIRGTLTGMIVLMLAYFGSKMVLELILT
jgi:ABC-type uncharacterized transport system permease subunit